MKEYVSFLLNLQILIHFWVGLLWAVVVLARILSQNKEWQIYVLLRLGCSFQMRLEKGENYVNVSQRY